MCLILFSWQRHPRYALVFAANRDEYHARATAPAAFWEDAPRVLAGRDLEGGGTWAGMTAGGRIAALTNFRAGRHASPGAPSRGTLVSDYLRSSTPPGAYVAEVRERGDAYNGFNLLAGEIARDDGELHWCSNRAGAPRRLDAGVHGISNHLLDTPWPKVVEGKRALAALLEGDAAVDPARLLELLADTRAAGDDALPETGVGLELERALSPLFIDTPGYGTRSSTVILVERTGHVHFAERSFAPGMRETGTVTFEFDLQAGDDAARDARVRAG